MEMVIIPVIVAMELEIKNEEVEFQCQSWYNNQRARVIRRAKPREMFSQREI